MKFRVSFGTEVVFQLVGFMFEIFEYCCFLYDVIGELLPLHVVIAVDVDLVKEIG
jgi:hypothetical protein